MRDVPVADIEANPGQPRRRFEPAALDRLVASIQARGVLQPVLVRSLASTRFALIAGERRWRAAQVAGLTEIPAFVRDGIDDATALELALAENTARAPPATARARARGPGTGRGAVGRTGPTGWDDDPSPAIGASELEDKITSGCRGLYALRIEGRWRSPTPRSSAT